jgi:hypothetical protein
LLASAGKSGITRLWTLVPEPAPLPPPPDWQGIRTEGRVQLLPVEEVKTQKAEKVKTQKKATKSR